MTNTQIISERIIDVINENGGFDVFSDILRTLYNEAMRCQRSEVINAQPYERTPDRKAYANGFKPKTLKTRIGKIRVDVPQVRGGIDFYPTALERGTTTEQALVQTVAEMYIQGVSTRKVKPILDQLAGLDISSTSVSNATKKLDAILKKWRHRSLNDYSIEYLLLDARYEKVRVSSCVRDCALLIAVGVRSDGKRSVLGLSVSLSEAEIHWRTFFEALVERGARGLKMITSDDHPGLKAARKAVFGGVSWQRCQFHLQQNARKYVPKKSMEKSVADDLRQVFNANDLKQALERKKELVEKYQTDAPTLSKWIDENIEDGLTVFSLPEKHRVRLRTTNGMENLNRQIKRRTRTIGVFPNENALERIASALLMEQDEEWLCGKRYLDMDVEIEY